MVDVIGTCFVYMYKVNIHPNILGSKESLVIINILGPGQNGRHFPDDILKWIFLNENAWILIEISLKIVPRGPINNIPALVQVMAWHRIGDKPLSEPMLTQFTDAYMSLRGDELKPCDTVPNDRNRCASETYKFLCASNITSQSRVWSTDSLGRPLNKYQILTLLILSAVSQ